MADLTKDDIMKLAHLARIELTDDEVGEFAGEFSEILKYVALLDDADTTGLQPTSQVTGLVNVSRADEVIDYCYRPEAMLLNVPRVDGALVRVNRMIV